MALLVAFAGPTPASAATVISNPEVFVGAVYARLAKGGDYTPPEDIYTPHLASLWALEQRETPKGDVGRLDFLFWINGQDGTPGHLRLKTSPVDGQPGRQIVVAKFYVLTKPEVLQFYFERQGAAWKLDDVISLTPDSPWTLSVILKYGWAG